MKTGILLKDGHGTFHTGKSGNFNSFLTFLTGNLNYVMTLLPEN